MTRILVQRGSGSGSSSNPSRNSSLPGSSSARAEPQVTTSQVLSAVKDEEIGEEVQDQAVVDEILEFCGSSDKKVAKGDDLLMESFDNDQNGSSSDEINDSQKVDTDEIVGPGELMKGMGALRISDRPTVETEGSSANSALTVSGTSHPPPPPVPPPKPSAGNSNSRRVVSRRAVAWPVVSTRTSPTGSRPSSPRSHGESEGYNSADEQNPCFVSSYDDIVSC
jgi:OTU domain-containing protein 5